MNETTVISLLYKVPFPGVVVDTLVFVFRAQKMPENHRALVGEYEASKPLKIRQKYYLSSPGYRFEYYEDADQFQVIKKMESLDSVRLLGEICATTSGFGGKSKLISKSKIKEEQIPVLKGANIGRYTTHDFLWFEFVPENITGRTTDVQKLGAIPKVLLRKTGDSIIATYDDTGRFPEQSLYFLYNNASQMDFRFFLGLLNSVLLTYYYRAKSLTNKKSIAQVKKVDLDRLPIRTIDFDEPADVARHDRMVALVERNLALHRDLAAAKTPQAQRLLQQQITLTDQAIDTLVYDLYALTPEEITIVEK